MKLLSPDLFSKADKSQQVVGTVAGFSGGKAIIKVGTATVSVQVSGAQPQLGAKVVAFSTPAGYICLGSVGAATNPKKIIID